MRHDYRIEGHVNGRHVLGQGSGRIDSATGVSEMDVTFEQMPDSWDPRTIVLMCCDRALVMAAQETTGTVGMLRASGGLLSIGRHLPGNSRDSVIRSSSGELMAHVQATSITDFRAAEPFDHSRIEGGFSHLRRGVNGIKRIPGFDGVMMQAGPGLVVVTTRFTAELEDGSTVYGTTNYPHYLPEQAVQVPHYQILRVVSVEQNLTGNHLYSQVTTQVLPLAPPADDAMSATVERLAGRHVRWTHHPAVPGEAHDTSLHHNRHPLCQLQAALGVRDGAGADGRHGPPLASSRRRSSFPVRDG
jgi:hypothetical protein